MKRIKGALLILLIVGLGGCNSGATQQKTETETTEKMEIMEPQELGTEIGKSCAEGFNFLYESMGDNPPVTDELKKSIRAERERIFGKLVPMIRQFQQLSGDDATECRQAAGFSMAESLGEVETKTQKITEALVALGEKSDMDFVRDIQCLYMVLMFLDVEEMKSFAPELLEHVGL